MPPQLSAGRFELFNGSGETGAVVFVILKYFKIPFSRERTTGNNKIELFKLIELKLSWNRLRHDGNVSAVKF